MFEHIKQSTYYAFSTSPYWYCKMPGAYYEGEFLTNERDHFTTIHTNMWTISDNTITNMLHVQNWVRGIETEQIIYKSNVHTSVTKKQLFKAMLSGKINKSYIEEDDIFIILESIHTFNETLVAYAIHRYQEEVKDV